jgi:hypothetical protein
VLKVFQAVLIAALRVLAVVMAQAAAKSDARCVKAASMAVALVEKAVEMAASRVATAAATHGRLIVFGVVMGGVVVDDDVVCAKAALADKARLAIIVPMINFLKETVINI